LVEQFFDALILLGVARISSELSLMLGVMRGPNWVEPGISPP